MIADIPGLIEGASDGAGLGIQFLRHVARTSLLLHLVDIAPIDGTDAAAQVRAIELELEKFNPELLERPRWLVLNKADMLAEDERQAVAEKIIAELELDPAVVPGLGDRPREHHGGVPAGAALLRFAARGQCRTHRHAAERRAPARRSPASLKQRGLRRVIRRNPPAYMRNTPKRCGSIGALSDAEIASPSTRRVSAGSMMPSSHSRALA